MVKFYLKFDPFRVKFEVNLTFSRSALRLMAHFMGHQAGKPSFPSSPALQAGLGKLRLSEISPRRVAPGGYCPDPEGISPARSRLRLPAGPDSTEPGRARPGSV